MRPRSSAWAPRLEALAAPERADWPPQPAFPCAAWPAAVWVALWQAMALPQRLPAAASPLGMNLPAPKFVRKAAWSSAAPWEPVSLKWLPRLRHGFCRFAAPAALGD